MGNKWKQLANAAWTMTLSISGFPAGELRNWPGEHHAGILQPETRAG
jgi:hypothetical protein